MKYIAVIADGRKYWVAWYRDYLDKTLGDDVVVNWNGHRVVNGTTQTEYFYVDGNDNDLVGLRGRIIEDFIELCGLSEYQWWLLNRRLNRNKQEK